MTHTLHTQNVHHRTQAESPRQSGFTLLELIITLTLLGIMLLGVMGLIPTALSQMARSEARAQASNLLVQKVEYLRRQRFGSSELMAGPHSEIHSPYKLVWYMTDDIPVTGAKQMKALISWVNTSADPESISVTTYLVDKP